MAYASEIDRKCGRGACDKRATHEVKDIRNTSYGTFCKRHADELVRQLKAQGK